MKDPGATSDFIQIPFRHGKSKIEVMLEDARFKSIFGIAQSDWK
ncbi:MAG: hypothetical protein ACYTFG_16905 [Planctomycetota bacterium]|jgi:hypothetical protein